MTRRRETPWVASSLVRVFGVRAAVLVAGLAAWGCGRGAEAAGDGPDSASSAVQMPAGASAECVLEDRCAVPARAVLVAMSDQMAIGASGKTGADRARAELMAAELRRRAWRTYHAASDAREAIEQYKQAARSPDTKVACEASLGALTLAAELEGDLTSANAAAYSGLKREPGGPCSEGLDKVVHELVAYRPAAERLAAIDEQLRRERAPAGPAADHDQGPVLSPTGAAGMGPARIERVESFGAKDAARVVIHLSGPAKFQVGHIAAKGSDEKARLYIDVARTSRGKVPQTRAVGGLVERVRVGSQGDATRVVLDLREAAWRRVFYLTEPFRIVADISKNAPAGEPGAADRPRAHRVERVVLDPGHGGNDPGAIGPGGLKEKDVTLDIAHRVAPILARELGIVTMVTRDADRYVALEERAARANAFHADLFVSIHCNASESPGGRGLQSYVLEGSRDDAALRVAARENATSANASSELASVVGDLRLGHLHGESLRLANLIQRATLASLSEQWGDTVNGGVKSAAFYVLVGAEMPSVLFEASFISNPVEESRLATAQYRQKLADGIANAIRAYREGR
jgi:N-acetylmuramoyl-L-alanine amidase